MRHCRPNREGNEPMPHVNVQSDKMMMAKCIMCARDAPLISGRYAGDGNWICGRPRCRLEAFIITHEFSRKACKF